MKVYKCILTGAEIITDSFKIEELPNGLIRVKGRFVVEDGGIDDRLIGGNKSAEGGDEDQAEDTAVKVIDVVNSCKLEGPNDVTKDLLKVFFKKYVTQVKELLKEDPSKNEQLTKFLSHAQECTKWILKNHKTIQMLQGSTNSDSTGEKQSFVFINWEDDADGNECPYLYAFLDALEEEKL